MILSLCIDIYYYHFIPFIFYLNFKIDCSSLRRRSCPSWHNDNRNKCFRIKEVAASRKREKTGTLVSNKYFRKNFSTDRLLSWRRIFEVISFRMPFRGRRVAVSSACFHRALSLEAKDLIMLPGTKVKSLAPRGIRSTKKGQKALQHFLPVSSSLFRRPHSGPVQENLPRRFNFVYLGMLPREKEEDREIYEEGREDAKPEQKPVNRLRDTSTIPQRENFKLLFWRKAI